MNLLFFEDGPALIVKNKKRLLVVADLHFGIESDLALHGWHFASKSTERLTRVIACVQATNPDLLVLLGDVKHSIPRTSRQEYREIPDILSALREHVPIRVLPGNHDIGIARFLKEGELLPKDGAVIDGVAYMHGHTIPNPYLSGHLIIAGHHHPMVSLYDEVGCSLRAPGYLLAGIDEGVFHSGNKLPPLEKTRVLFMPAFNECAGFDILRIIHHPFSPLSRSIRTDRAEVFCADGTYIGPVSALEEHVPD
jgi:metallophosphoesterase superfamily enzyme